MPVRLDERFHDPDDPDGAARHLATPEPTGDQHTSPWVEPDYTAIAPDEELSGPGPFENWPGPPLIMPAGLLPDGKPASRNEMDNAERIEGVRPRNDTEADSVVVNYMRQQRLLRDRAGLPRPTSKPPKYKREDTPETLEAIAELHRRERVRRADRVPGQGR